MANRVSRNEIEEALARKIEALRKEGVPWWPGIEIAPIAYRRWFSCSRRFKGSTPQLSDRIADLAKGLRSHFEPNTPYTHPREWEVLSTELASVFLSYTSPNIQEHE